MPSFFICFGLTREVFKKWLKKKEHERLFKESLQNELDDNDLVRKQCMTWMIQLMVDRSLWIQRKSRYRNGLLCPLK